MHPLEGSHESSVQLSRSAQLGGAPPTHTPLEQASPVVQALPSLHALVLLTYWHPNTGSQLSSVQAFPSPHVGGAPPTHTPPAHVSPVVHALPSLHGSLLFVNTQPIAGSHVSVVQTLPSLHASGGPPTHTPAAHTSFVVQAFPSVHADTFSTCAQPVAGVQESSVQTLPSLQSSGGPPTQAPTAHVSSFVQALPSSHATVLLAKTQSPA
jgi:hypothetical protein